MLRPNLEGLLRKEKEKVWKDVFRLCLAGTRREVRAANRTHLYGSGIRVNVPKGRYNTFFQEQCDRRS